MSSGSKSASSVPLLVRVRNGDAFAEYRFDAEPQRTVLDILEMLRSCGEAVPAYRHSCHHGSCGTCGAIINGVEALMCLTTVASLASPRPRLPGGPAVEPERDGRGAFVVSLEPLAKMAVISGIAVSPGAALAGIPLDAAYLGSVPDDGRSPLPPEPPAARVESAVWRPAGRRPTGRVRFEACIECGLCVSACPVAVPFIGPAALAAINREREKRPERAAAMRALAAAPDGVGPCGRHLACSRVCPQAVYPGKHIQLLRTALAQADTAGR